MTFAPIWGRCPVCGHDNDLCGHIKDVSTILSKRTEMDAKEAKRLVKEATETTAKDRYKTVLDDLLQAIRERSNEGYSSILIKAYEDDDHLLARLVNELKSKGFEVITYKLYLAIFWE